MSISEMSSYLATNATASNTALTSSKETLAAQALDKDDFLKLLTTELTHQDPTAPMDNKDLILQLSQFSTLEATTNLNENMARFITDSKQSNAAALLGKEVAYYDSTSGGLYTGAVTGVVTTSDGPALVLDNTTTVKLSQVALISNPSVTAETETTTE